jgi:hypothetical protein
VDGISHRPTGDRNVQWPADTAADRVLGRLERFAPAERMVAATCDTAYPGLTLRRGVRLLGDLILDHFTVRPTPTGPEGAAGAAFPAAQPAAEHQFDYILHVDGAPAGGTVELAPRSGPLGDRCGYQHVTQKAGAVLARPAALDFDFGHRRIRLWLVPVGGPAELTLAEGLTNSPTVRMAMVVVRRRGQAAEFVTLLEPISGAPRVTALGLQQTAGVAPTILITRGGNTTRLPAP